MSRPIALVLALICLIALPASAQDGWIDDFDNADLWTGINTRAPAEVRAENGILTIIDPPGGKVTWGTSVSASLPPIDLDRYPYLVVKLVEVTNTFRVTLVNQDKKEKVGGLCPATKPGIIVLDVRNTLGWTGKTNMSLGLYASGTESRVKVDYVKFTGTLSPEEAKAYERWKAMQPKRPKPFHGMEELASRRGWVHEPYFRVDPAADPKASKPWVENFENVKAWVSNNPKTPPEFSAENGILTLKDPPGGEVTWGTSIYARLDSVDLSKNPYLVAKVADLSSAFHITLVNPTTGQKIGGLCGTEKPGIVVVNLIERLGWQGATPLQIGLYTNGTESWVKVDCVKITGELTPEEQAAYDAQRTTEAASAKRFSMPDSRPIYSPVLQPGTSYLSERLIYRDSVTGNPVWRITHYPDTDCVVYYDFMHWNADGTRIRWNSSRGGSPQWLMNADGTDLRAFEIPSRTRGYSANWSIHDPNILFYSSQDGDRSVVYAYDIATGKEAEVMALDEPGFSMAPPHPDEKHFLLSKRSKAKNTSVIYLLGPDGLKRKLDFGRFVHRLRFTKSPGHDIFYNFDDPRTQWAIGADKTNNVQLTGTAGHPDWTRDGKWLTTYMGGKIEAISRDGKGGFTLCELHAGGHGSSALDCRTFCSDVSRGGPYGNGILAIDVPTRITHLVCMAWSSFYGHDNTAWHPHHHSTHPHPSCSPDGTKTIFSSDFMSKYTNVYVCINHLPDAPGDPKVKNATLTWQPGERHRETAGYCIHHAEQSGGPYRQINAEPVKETSFPLDRTDGFLVVTAVEPGGLESLPSLEICAAPTWQGPVRRVVEAEACKLDEGMRPWIEAATAVGMFYVGLDRDREKGSMTLHVNIPKPGKYTLLARMRGDGKLRSDAGTLASSSGEWAWVRMDGPLSLDAGEQSIALSVAEGKPQVDQFVVTDEPGFAPKGPMVLDAQAPDPPKGLTAKVLDPFNVRLSWTKPDSVDVAYYNVYCGTMADYVPCQARLIGSPAETRFLDWGLAGGTEYHYKVVAVDRAGNESKPAAVTATTSPAKIASVTVEADQGKVAEAAKVVDDKNATNGKAVELPAGKKGLLEITFELPFDGRYALWAHAYQTEGKPHAVAMVIDGKVKQSWRPRIPMKRWGWDSMGGKRSGDPQLFVLRKGTHTLTLQGKEGQRIDRIVISNDPRWPHYGFRALRRSKI